MKMETTVNIKSPIFCQILQNESC